MQLFASINKVRHNYTYYHYGHLGNYLCPNKDFERGKVNFEGTNINLDKQIMNINNNEMKINNKALYVCYAYLATYSLLSSIGIKEKDIVNAFNNHKIETKRGKELTYNKRSITMLETKNENNLSYYQSIKYIVNQKETKTVI